MGVSSGSIIRSVVDREAEPCAGILFFLDAKRLGTNLLENSPQNRFFVAAPVPQRRRTRLAAAAPKLPTTNTVSLANDLFLGGDDASSAVVIIVVEWLY